MPLVSSRTARTLTVALLAFTLVAPGSAFAKKGKKKKSDDGIWEVGVASIDDFFSDVDSIDRSLDKANRLLDGARTDLNSALGLNKKTTIPKALAELDARADGKLKLVMKGKVPTLAASDAVPTDVTAGIDAVNGFTNKMHRSITALADAPAAAASLAKKSKALPEQTREELEGNLLASLFKAPKALKAVNHNVGITRKLPSKTDKTVTRLDRINRSVIDEFGGAMPGKSKGGTKGKKG